VWNTTQHVHVDPFQFICADFCTNKWHLCYFFVLEGLDLRTTLRKPPHNH
jgi:hypothetical protein